MKRLLIGLSLVLLMLPATAWSMVSTTNTGFEEGFGTPDAGVANGWYAYGLNGTTSAPSEGTEVRPGSAGSKSQKTDSTPGYIEGGIKARFDVASGHVYTVGVWVKAPAGGAYLAVRTDAEENGDVVNAQGSFDVWNSSDDWQQITKTVTTTGTAITIFFDAWDCVAYWDDVTITDLGSAASVGPAPVQEIWYEDVYWQNAGAANAGDPLGHGQVLVDGNKAVIAEGDAGMLLYADKQTSGTAFVSSTPNFSYGWPTNYATKGGTLLNGRLYSQDAFYNIYQCTAWSGSWGTAMNTGRSYAVGSDVESDCIGLLTDGTYLYGSDNNGDRDNCSTEIYKWSVDPAANGGSGSLTQVWSATIPGPHSHLSSMGYYSGKLYAAEAFGGRNIYEIDCATGAYTALLTGDNIIPLSATYTSDGLYGQVARCGDRMVLVNRAGAMIQWKLVGTTWTIQSMDKFTAAELHTGADYFLGLTLKAGPDGNAKYAWTSVANKVIFWDLAPYSTQIGVGDARKMDSNYPAAVKDAVVTKVGAGEFWIEDQERTSGLRVAWPGTMPAVDTKVDVNGGMITADSGEKVMNAVSVGTGTPVTAIEPVFLTAKNLGPASGSAGLANDGMLVKVSGVFKAFDNYNAVYIDDGSGVASDLVGGPAGLKVSIPNPSAVPLFEEYIMWGSTPCNFTVTGIVRLEKLGDGTIIRRIDARSDADVVITAI